MSTENDELKQWQEANQRHLERALDDVQEELERYVNGDAPVDKEVRETVSPDESVRDDSVETNLPLDILASTFHLTEFERRLLLLCAGVELRSELVELCKAAEARHGSVEPTFGLAIAALSGSHLSALSAERPLRRYRLVEIAGGPRLTSSPLKIDEKILSYLTGVNALDRRLEGYVRFVSSCDELTASQLECAEQAAVTWSQQSDRGVPPVLNLRGGVPGDLPNIAYSICSLCGMNMYVMAASHAPSDPRELASFIRLWEREAVLGHSALFIDNVTTDSFDAARTQAIIQLLEQLPTPLLIAGDISVGRLRRPLQTIEVAAPTVAERCDVWRAALGPSAAQLDGDVELLAIQHNLSASAIRTVVANAVGQGKSAPAGGDATEGDLRRKLSRACRLLVRSRMENLAQRIDPKATWDDIVLPDTLRSLLREIAIHVRYRIKVYDQWGFAAKHSRGLGVSALFSGPSGTGKTMAAEVLANELELDLYRIDLSQVVSKYIGETEKNLRRVFDAAEESGAILLFDEADALFGKRSEVKDSHDRFANIEISYLLQRMESYHGLAILTTNFRSALDKAFLRRLRFVAEFQFPDEAQRLEIWRRAFPGQTPTAGLAFERLARLNIAGGNIVNIAMKAAFLAAGDCSPVSMAHLLEATKTEFTKMQRPLSPSEMKDWV